MHTSWTITFRRTLPKPKGNSGARLATARRRRGQMLGLMISARVVSKGDRLLYKFITHRAASRRPTDGTSASVQPWISWPVARRRFPRSNNKTIAENQPMSASTPKGKFPGANRDEKQPRPSEAHIWASIYFLQFNPFTSLV